MLFFGHALVCWFGSKAYSFVLFLLHVIENVIGKGDSNIIGRMLIEFGPSRGGRLLDKPNILLPSNPLTHRLSNASTSNPVRSPWPSASSRSLWEPDGALRHQMIPAELTARMCVCCKVDKATSREKYSLAVYLVLVLSLSLMANYFQGYRRFLPLPTVRPSGWKMVGSSLFLVAVQFSLRFRRRNLCISLF